MISVFQFMWLSLSASVYGADGVVCPTVLCSLRCCVYMVWTTSCALRCCRVSYGVVVCLAVLRTARKRAKKREENRRYWERLQQDPQRYRRILQRQKHYKRARRQRNTYTEAAAETSPEYETTEHQHWCRNRKNTESGPMKRQRQSTSTYSALETPPSEQDQHWCCSSNTTNWIPTLIQ